jgi:DUF4097 and DUF4098 domain-containing protein YvlB
MRLTVLTLVALTLAGPAAAEQKETEKVDRTIAFAPGGTLKLKNFSGDVRITGTAGSEVIIHAVRTAARDRLDNIRLDIAVDGSTIAIEANRRSRTWDQHNDNVVETRFDIQVPAATNLDLHNFSGDLTVSDTTADIEAQTFSGSIDLDVSRATGIPELKAETFSGDIRTRVSPGGAGRVQFHTFSGDLRSDVPLMLHSGSRKNITADLGSGSGPTLEFKTFSGDLRLLK